MENVKKREGIQYWRKDGDHGSEDGHGSGVSAAGRCSCGRRGG